MPNLKFTENMKKIAALVAALFAAGAVSIAGSVFAESTKSDYNITESTSLGGSVSITSDVVVHQSTGNVSGTVQFNTKTKTIKFVGRKVKYEKDALVSKVVGHSCITSGKGILVGDGREVIFQVIEDLRDNRINMIVKWPDFSSVRFLGELKSRSAL